MTTIHLIGHVTDESELVFDPPKNLPPREAKITITYIQRQFTSDDISTADDQDITGEEVK